jgi:hypothetical protein
MRSEAQIEGVPPKAPKITAVRFENGKQKYL